MRFVAMLVGSMVAVVPARATSPQCHTAQMAGLEKLGEFIAAGKSLTPNAPPTPATCRQALLALRLYRQEITLSERSQAACDLYDPGKIEAQRARLRTMSAHFEATYCGR